MPGLMITSEDGSIMTESRKIVLLQTVRIAVGQVVCIGLMFGIYALLQKLALSVVLGGLVGAVISVGNFFFMAIVATLAGDKAQQQDVEGGQKLMKSAYPIRILVLAALLVLCIKSGVFDILSLLLPLLFVRPILMVQEFFTKKGV